jgi:hypothetical protein
MKSGTFCFAGLWCPSGVQGPAPALGVSFDDGGYGLAPFILVGFLPLDLAPGTTATSGCYPHATNDKGASPYAPSLSDAEAVLSPKAASFSYQSRIS